GWFRTGEEGAGFFRWQRRRSLIWISITALALVLVLIGTQALGQEMTQDSLSYWALGLFADAYNVAMSFLYISVISLLMLRASWQRRLAPLASVGKMALS